MNKSIIKIKAKSATIGIMGLGYVGLPMAVAFSKKFNVMGLAYKKNIDNARESPSRKIIEVLINRGTKVWVYDLM